ncbi:hypothetical protein BHM03_00026301 [Ensete ventricosum]|nr:hypothetical protein BHM03_00026301 [Ensete ventricosum]
MANEAKVEEEKKNTRLDTVGGILGRAVQELLYTTIVSFDRAADCQYDPLSERHCVKVACVCRGGHRHSPRVLGCQPTDRHRRSADVRESDGRRQPANTAGSHIPMSSPAVYDTARISRLVLSLLSENARPNRKHEIVANKHLKRGDEFVVRVKRRSTLCPISVSKAGFT